MRFCSPGRLLFSLVFLLCVGAAAAYAADPVVVELHYQNGVKYYNRGLYDKAIAEFEKTLSLDPDRSDAQGYLDQARRIKEEKKQFDAGLSKDEQVRNLYKEGRQLYAKGDYETALEVFSKILEIKPIDDFASYYRERCEIFIGRKLARDKKIEDRELRKEKEVREKAGRQSAVEKKRDERRQMLDKRSEINEERRRARQEKIARRQEEEKALAEEKKQRPVTTEEKAAQREQKRAEALARDQEKAARKQAIAQEREAAAQEKVSARRASAEEKRQKARELKEERSAAAQEKRDAAVKAREEKQQASKERSIESAAKKEERVLEKKKARQEAEEKKEVRLSTKELYIKGVESYGRGLYEDAIVSFEAVIEAERGTEEVYSNAARRLIDKVRKKQEASAR